MAETTDHGSEQQARAQLASIREMVAALDCDYDRIQELRDERDAWEAEHSDDRDWPAAMDLDELEEAAGECTDREDAERRIHEDALCVEVRSGWYTLDSDDDAKAPEEYRILLCTGGPTCQIIGQLDGYGQPKSARIQHQDWFTPWQDLDIESEDEQALLTYAQCFYFGS